MDDVKFAVRFESKEVMDYTGNTLTKDGARFWLVNERRGWVPATSQSADSDQVAQSAKVFDTKAEAESFMAKWKGHPWYCVPNGNYEIIPVRETFRQVHVGWSQQPATPPPAPPEGT